MKLNIQISPEIFALLTAICWGVGGYFEKQGLKLGNLSPTMGITIRTLIAFIILGIVSFPQWKDAFQAGPKALLYMVIGGGVVAGAAGDIEDGIVAVGYAGVFGRFDAGKGAFRAGAVVVVGASRGVDKEVFGVAAEGQAGHDGHAAELEEHV